MNEKFFIVVKTLYVSCIKAKLNAVEFQFLKPSVSHTSHAISLTISHFLSLSQTLQFWFPSVWRHGGLMVSALNSRSSGLGSSPERHFLS